MTASCSHPTCPADLGQHYVDPETELCAACLYDAVLERLCELTWEFPEGGPEYEAAYRRYDEVVESGIEALDLAIWDQQSNIFEVASGIASAAVAEPPKAVSGAAVAKGTAPSAVAMVAGVGGAGVWRRKQDDEHRDDRRGAGGLAPPHPGLKGGLIGANDGGPGAHPAEARGAAAGDFYATGEGRQQC